MKTKKIILSIFLATLTFISCSKDDNTETNITVDDATVNAKLDIVNDDLTNIVSTQLTSEDGVFGKNLVVTNNFLPNCASVTRVPDFGTVITPGTTIVKTIDFGTVGCPLQNGNVLKGIIQINFAYQPTATSHTINYEFINFYHNAIKLEGNKTFTRTMTTATATSPSHPLVTMNMDLTATFPNGNIHNRVGSRTSEIIEGYQTIPFIDNVYRVTGSWITTFPNASLISSTITTPLIVKFNCSNITAGIITFVRDNNSATLNYGDGTCDNQAIFTINGNSYPIVLGN